MSTRCGLRAWGFVTHLDPGCPTFWGDMPCKYVGQNLKKGRTSRFQALYANLKAFSNYFGSLGIIWQCYVGIGDYTSLSMRI